MALDTLTGMKVFRQAVERGSLAAAARAAGLSAEMAGHHLKSLEARLGVRLLNRTTRRIGLTDAGRAYYPRCVAILDEIALAEAEVGQQRTTPKGRLKIAAPLAFGRSALAAPVAAFAEQNPDVVIEIDLSERNVNLIEEGYDLALRLGDLPDSSLIVRRIAAFPLMLVAAPRYLSQSAAIGSPSDISGHQALIYTQTPAPTLWAFTDAQGQAISIPVTGRILASDVEFLLNLALQGRGLLLAPAFLLAEHLSTGRLVRLLCDWRTRTLPLHIVVPHRSLLPAAVRSFSEFLGKWFG